MKGRLIGAALVMALLLSCALTGAVPVSAQSGGSSEQGESTNLFLPYIHEAEEIQLQAEWGSDVWEGVPWLEDCVTGNNQFYNAGNDGLQWYINVDDPDVAGAELCDDYFTETYERPVNQVFASISLDQKPPYSPFEPDNSTFLSGLQPDSEFDVGNIVYATDTGTYFEYLDITRARYTSKGDWLLFQIELFGKRQVRADGARVGSFADDAYYTIRLGNNSDPNMPNGGIILRNELEEGIRPWWRIGWFDVKVYRDANGDAGGAGGVSVSLEGAAPGVPPVDAPGDGYERNMGNLWWLYARVSYSEFNGATRPVVEFAFNYDRYNELTNGPDFTPENITFVQFDATSGLDETGIYFYNDEFSQAEFGSPYDGSAAFMGECRRPCKPPKPKYTPRVDTLRENKAQQEPAISIKKFTLDEKEGLEAAVWNDANTLEEAAQIESQIIWRYVIRRISSADLTDVSVIDVPEPGKGPAEFNVRDFGPCVLVASDNIAEWDDPDYGYDYDAFNPPLYGLERFGVETIPDDLVQPGEQVNLTEDFPVLVCDVYGNSLVTNLNIGPITPGGSDVLLDTYYNEATATAFLGQTSNTASDTDISHFIGINCAAFPELCGLPPTP